MSNWLAGLAVVLAVIGYVPYLRSILRGETRPNRASWLIFSVAAAGGVASSWAAGARGTVGVPATYAICCMVIFLFAIRRGEGGWSLLDRCCLGGAAAGLVLWWATGEPMLAIIMNCLVDAAGAVPTLVKAWREPQREDGVSWLFWLAAGVCNLAQIRAFHAADVLYPGTLALAALLIVLARYRHLFRAPVRT